MEGFLTLHRRRMGESRTNKVEVFLASRYYNTICKEPLPKLIELWKGELSFLWSVFGNVLWSVHGSGRLYNIVISQNF